MKYGFYSLLMVGLITTAPVQAMEASISAGHPADQGLTVTAEAQPPFQIITIAPLASAPVIDGSGLEWAAQPVQVVALTPTVKHTHVETRQVEIKAGHYQNRVYFWLRWQDSEPDALHKPYQWDEKKQRYGRGPQREDRLAMQFEISGEYNTNWPLAQDFVADMWHWKASRSNPIGLAHDKKTTLSSQKLLRAASLKAADGSIRYVLRENDQGTPLYSNKRYATKQQEIMPKYQLNPHTRGSIADISAKGIWAGGYWQLELSREFDTGHDDDVLFTLGQALRGGIAVFDRGENDDHAISETLIFQF